MVKYRSKTVRSLGLCAALALIAAACSDKKVDISAPESGDMFNMAGDSQAARFRPAPRPASPDEPAASGASDAGAASGDPIALPPTVSITPTGTLLCGNHVCQCNNGVDDDGDGTADGFDVECTGGIDDDEGSFATGIPGDNRDPKWQDCFFDGNSGAGDDRCRYPTECLTGELSLDDDACAVTQQCRDNCQPRTPAGCDCFGCCAVEIPGNGVVNVLLTDSCSLEKIGDTDACPVCTPNPSCQGPGEPVDPGTPSDPVDPSEPGDPGDPGQPGADAGPPPADCTVQPECSEAVDCPVGEFCSFGCCLVVIQ